MNTDIRMSDLCENRFLAVRLLGVSLPVVLFLGMSFAGAAAQDSGPKTPRMTCGECPEGYATTGVTSAPSICKEEDPTLLQCVPLGASRLAVCGSCPEGYTEVGSSSVPSQCGGIDGGRVSQCQLEKVEGEFANPSEGGIFCPPNCGGEPPKAGQGPIPPPPRYPVIPDEEK